jgi:Arc/MetJ family transcription regulator
MRTNIDIDDALMNKAMSVSGHKTKKETVEAALQLLVKLKSQEAIREARGKLRWDGDLEAIRRDG